MAKSILNINLVILLFFAFANNSHVLANNYDVQNYSGCISHQPFPNKLNLFPNPATNFVEIGLMDFSEVVEFKIVSIVGQEIKKGSITEKMNRIDTFELAPGQYILKLTTKDYRQASILQIK